MESNTTDNPQQAAKAEAERLPQHWITCVKWKTVKDWKSALHAETSKQSADSESLSGEAEHAASELIAYPYQYANKQPRMMEMREDDVLWLISVPKYGQYCQAPTIVARLELENVIDKTNPKTTAKTLDNAVKPWGNYVAIGKKIPGSYLPLNNVYRRMLGFKFSEGKPDMRGYVERDKSKDAKYGPYYQLPNSFLQLRHLDEDTARDLDLYAKAVRTGHRLFLSYRRQDFFPTDDAGKTIVEDPVWARQLGEALLDRGACCWWDQWYIPDLQGEHLDPDLLSGILQDGVRQAVWFIGLMTPGYFQTAEQRGDTPWTLLEWERAKEETVRTARRDPMRRIAVYFGDRPDRPRNWVPPPCQAGDQIIWAGHQPSIDPVADQILQIVDSADQSD